MLPSARRIAERLHALGACRHAVQGSLQERAVVGLQQRRHLYCHRLAHVLAPAQGLFAVVWQDTEEQVGQDDKHAAQADQRERRLGPGGWGA